MTENDIPEPVRRLLAEHIDSIEQIEVLMLLRAQPEREWSAEEVNRELRSSVMSIQDRLGGLAAMGFLVAREAGADLVYRYAPASDEVRGVIDALEAVYKARRFSVINLIYAKPESDVMSFSEAFRITRKRQDE